MRVGGAFEQNMGQSCWFCVTDRALSVAFASAAASRWLGMESVAGICLAVHAPELAEAILAADEGDFPLTCSLGEGDSSKQPVMVVVHKLKGPLAGYVCCEKTVKREECTQFRANELPDCAEINRKATIGLLVGGVAHEFNNMLTGMLGHLAYLHATLTLEGDHRESLLAIEEGARRASALTRSLTAVGRSVEDDTDSVSDACSVVRELGGLLRTIVPPTVLLTIDIPELPVWIRGQNGLIAEILVHFTSAFLERESRPRELRLAVREATSAPTEQMPPDEELGSTFVVVSIGEAEERASDDSRSFSPPQLSRLERVYAFLASRAKASGGWVARDSSSGESYLAGIEIWLPREPKRGAGQPDPWMAERGGDSEAVDRETLPRGDERILVLDDEPSVRNVIVMSLERLGYAVTAVDSGEFALEAYRSTPQPFDLVVLDMILPEVSGDEVFSAIRRINPRARVLVLSGFSPEGRIERLLAEGGCLFLQKPFAIGELAWRVRDCLELPFCEVTAAPPIGWRREG